MFVAIVIATVLDLGLGFLLVAVSGFILQGVNNTGLLMPDAVFFVLMIGLCLGAPVATWTLRKRIASPALLAIAYSPLIVMGVALMLEPIFL